MPGVIPVTHHLECSHCAYDLYGLVAEAYVEVHRAGRIVIRRMVRCPECGLLQRYLASAPGGHVEPYPLIASPPAPHERSLFTIAVVAALLFAGILLLLLIGFP